MLSLMNSFRTTTSYPSAACNMLVKTSCMSMYQCLCICGLLATFYIRSPLPPHNFFNISKWYERKCAGAYQCPFCTRVSSNSFKMRYIIPSPPICKMLLCASVHSNRREWGLHFNVRVSVYLRTTVGSTDQQLSVFRVSKDNRFAVVRRLVNQQHSQWAQLSRSPLTVLRHHLGPHM